MYVWRVVSATGHVVELYRAVAEPPPPPIITRDNKDWEGKGEKRLETGKTRYI